MSEFDELRPYNDSEVRSVLNRLLHDHEFLDAIAKLRLPSVGKYVGFAVRPLIRKKLSKETAEIHSVKDFQDRLELYLGQVLERSINNLSVSGLENLRRDKAHLFISNHRDIAMDPALVNWTLYHNGFTTLRIAIGDNLLTKPFASDLMRLNKSFIVNRSATAPREKLRAAKLLSRYISHSVQVDNENVWIAQREGRAKDGIDKSNSAIISMLAMSRDKEQTLSHYIENARIVPVSISYEYDPCDTDKARELYHKQVHGEYTKDEHEDVQSIAKGITDFKGNVHISFGEELQADYESTDDVALDLDEIILENYVLHGSNCFAYEILQGKSPDVLVGEKQVRFIDSDMDAERKIFKERLAQSDEKFREIYLRGYANPVFAKLGELK